MSATSEFIGMVEAIDIKHFGNSFYYNSISNEGRLGMLGSFEKVLKQEISFSTITRWTSHKSTYYSRSHEWHN